jgi:hypothetical protein
MDTAIFVCSGCGYQKSVPATHIGKKAKCPKCQMEGRIGEASQQASAQTRNVIKFHCPICDQKLGAALQHAGKWIKCGKCQNPAQVPLPEEAVDQSSVQSAAARVRAAAEATPPPQMGDIEELARMERETSAIERPRSQLSLATAPVEAAPSVPDIYTRPPRAAQLGDNSEAEDAVKSSAGWLYAVAGLSLVNTFIIWTGSSRVFAIGLGITQLLDGIRLIAAKEAPSAAGLVTAIVLVLDILIAAMYATMAYFAGKGKVWVFVVAIVCYALDTVISVLAFQIISIILHIVVLFCLANGIRASLRLRSQPSAA